MVTRRTRLALFGMLPATAALVVLICGRALCEGDTPMDDRPRFESGRADGRYTTTAGLVHALMRSGRPKLAFDPAMSPEQFEVWRVQVRDKLRELLNFPQSPPQPGPTRLWVEDRDGYRLEKWELYPEPLSVVPFLVLIPDGLSETKWAPAVLCFPGSGSSKELLAGEAELDGSRATGGRSDENRMAWWYCKAGFVAVAVDNPGYAELEDPVVPGTRELSVNGAWLGRSYEAISAFQKLRVLDWVRECPEVDPARIAISGFSLGAKPGALMMALCPDIRALIWNDSVVSWRERAVATNLLALADLQYIPGLLEWLDYPDILASLAPRPLVISEGGRTRDLDRIRAAYQLMGAEANFRVEHYPRYATPESRPHDEDDLPEGLTMQEYFAYGNVDPRDHYFKPDIAVPWLTGILKP